MVDRYGEEDRDRRSQATTTIARSGGPSAVGGDVWVAHIHDVILC